MASNSDLAHRFFDEVITKGDVDVIDDIIADDIIEHQQLPGITGSGKEVVKTFANLFKSSFSDVSVEVLAISEAGDEVWTHTITTATHTGEFNGIPPTNKTVSWEAIDRVRVKDGKAVEHWGVSDDLGMLTQLGVIPEQ